jgi:hypothetical protein
MPDAPPVTSARVPGNRAGVGVSTPPMIDPHAARRQ